MIRFGRHFGSILPPFGGPKNFHGAPLVGSFFACYFCVVLDHLQDGPRGAQEAPRPPQERPKRLQEAPKSAPRGSKRTSTDPKSRSRGLYNSKDVLLRCPATECKTGMPKAGGRAAVSPPKGQAIRRPFGVSDNRHDFPSTHHLINPLTH